LRGLHPVARKGATGVSRPRGLRLPGGIERLLGGAAIVLGLAAGGLTLAPDANAIYGPAAGGLGADIVSVNIASDEQSNAETTDAAISADGRYVVFQTKATNFFEDDGESKSEQEAAEPPGTVREGGVFRYDRTTGELRLVASGNLVVSEGPEAGKLLVRGAENPSVSEDGRYVVFSSAQHLASQVSGESIQVYERDLDKQPGEAGAYELVSARDGGEEPSSFKKPGSPIAGGDPGAELWPNSSISANGRYVIFHTVAPSDLPAQKSTSTPPHQLFVRDLLEKKTVLLSRDATTGEPVESSLGPVLGAASISADGSTVAWVSTDAQAQTRFLLGESSDTSQPYYLWRRWQEPGSVTRRITGMADPEDSECPAEGTVSLAEPTATGPCYGPLTEPESSGSSIASSAPSLSANGYEVAFLASPGMRPEVAKPGNLDVFVTSMSPGVSRKADTRQLTLSANGSGGRSLGSVESLTLSQDGSTIAFNAYRDLYVLGDPAPVGTFSPQPTESELYVVHLAAHTLERAVLGYGKGEPNGSTADNPTLTADGATVAFVSGASNLIFGDIHNEGFNDAFTATLQAPTGTSAPPPEVNSTQSGVSLVAGPLPELGLHVKRGKSGSLLLLVETPGPGALTAHARGVVPAKRGKSHGKRRKLRTVELGHASATARSEGTTTIVLRLASKYARDLKRDGKLRALVTVSFKAPAPAEALAAEANATFAASGRAAARRARAKK
jgi:Tol biopolymer transport system component